jgi:hypothetical protein
MVSLNRSVKQNEAYASIWLLRESLGLHTPHGELEAFDAKHCLRGRLVVS